MLATQVFDSLLHIFFPHVCEGCGSDHLGDDSLLCMSCINNLPNTHFHMHVNNPVEKAFWGRVPITAAWAQYYFTKESLIQHLMHGLKYQGKKELGWQLGRLMGNEMKKTNRLDKIDLLIPLPLHPLKERKRGYNQATLLCEGIQEETGIKVNDKIVTRRENTQTQTRKTRMERWNNLEGRFEVTDPEIFEGKHVLLVDDVMTTGATLESCASELMKIQDTRVSIGTLCIASR